MASSCSRPLTLPCGFELPNRLAKAALTEGLADVHNRVTPELERLYARWSSGGVGLQITGNVMVDGRWLERAGNLVLDASARTSTSAMEGLARLAEAGKSGGSAFFMQLNHPGRQVNRFVSSAPIAPSASGAVALLGFFAAPREMRDEEIEATLDQWAAAAGAAKTAGFDGVQIHAAHGYLLSQFLSPRINRREDRWGGSLEGRARALLEAVRRTRAEVGPNYPISVKLNSADFQRGGFDEAASMQVVEMLEAEGIDLLEISGGNYESMALFGLAEGQDDKRAASTRAREAYFLEYAEAVRERTRIPLMLTGGFRTSESVSHALDSGAVDVVGLGRPLIMDPDFADALLRGEAAPSPAGPIRTPFRKLNTIAEAGWYARQIYALAEGRAPDPTLGAMSSALLHLVHDVRRALAWRRARR